MERLFQIYKRLLEIHIQSFTTWTQFHKDTEEAYNTLFDVFHAISEMQQALWQEPTTDCCDNGQESYDLIEEAKSINEKLVKSNKEIWFDNLLRSLSEKLVLLCWNFKQYTKEMDDEEEQEEIQEPKLMPGMKIWLKMK